MTNVGDIIKKERLRKGLNLNDIEKKTKIRKKYLEAIEKNNWNIFSSKIYIIGILKNYSKFLGLDQEKIIAFFRRDYEKREELDFKRRISQKYFNPEYKVLFKRFFFFIFLFFFLYFFYQLYLYFTPPKLEILFPKENFFKNEKKIKIIGKTDAYASIIIFGQRVYQNKDGIFEYDFPLKEGENKLIIEVTGSNGRKTIFEKKFINHKPD